MEGTQEVYDMVDLKQILFCNKLGVPLNKGSSVLGFILLYRFLMRFEAVASHAGRQGDMGESVLTNDPNQ